METIIISGVNLVDGGTYTIMRECLEALSMSEISHNYKIIAIVHKKEIYPSYDNIEYIEYPKSKKSYLLRLYYEYFKFYGISKKFCPILWLSLHDMSPIVKAHKQAVYMHNPSPFLGKPKSLTLRGIGFSYLYKYIYRINIHANDYLIVQQQWLRDAFSNIFNISPQKIIVARPISNTISPTISFPKGKPSSITRFVYASYPRSFKNFELICEAVKLLTVRGINHFIVTLTINGKENTYSKHIFEKYSYLSNIEFVGLQPREQMDRFYSESDCLIFPSKAETWGLPISEYLSYCKPMILADLPYAYETAAGADRVSFINVNEAEDLAQAMEWVINRDYTNFQQVPKVTIQDPTTHSWEELISLLLNN